MDADDVLRAVGLTVGVLAIAGAATCYDMSEAEDAETPNGEPVQGSPFQRAEAPHPKDRAGFPKLPED